ncbi:MAG TPA: hypothetical protein VHX49_12710, partial [Candidatus Acidoferrales bacterium]|nr:hypothetical protein [Candidatus Acidoferrales bacterium]
MTAQGFLRSLVLALFVVAFASVSQAAAQQHWVATWAASAQSARIVFPHLPPPPPPASGAPAPAARPLIFPPPPPLDNQTVRMIVRSSIGG